MSVFPPVIRFRGSWRPYQTRVLNNLRECLEDRKIHLVAAPGSGKTTVGLEILLRLGRPALILAPSVTIREQWAERFRTAFLPEGGDAGPWISTSIRTLKPLTVVTYQALHSAYSRLAPDADAAAEDAAEGGDAEGAAGNRADSAAACGTDYTDFDLIATLQAAKIGTVCMDEAHHLRSEWWKALEAVVKALGGVTTVSLTATPPYDSTPAEWQRYTALCGEIDEEIFTPELIREKNLCPHQDYVYFSWPEKDEIEAVRAFRENAVRTALAVAREPEFVKAVCGHPGLADVDGHAEYFLDHPDYLTALLVFLKHSGAEIPKELRRLIGTSAALPGLDLRRMQVLLQGFLFDDADSYPDCGAYRDALRRRLAKLGLVRRRAVTLTAKGEIDRMLITSRGKLAGIREIVRAEYAGLGGRLRLLVLTDFIRKEFLSAVGRPETEIGEIGVVPIFETLRRARIPGLKLGVLSGSVVIVPSGGAPALLTLAGKRGVALSCRPLGDPGYVSVDFAGSSREQTVSLLTDFFRDGGVQVLIGTKSLLGEGWDSPCVNSLILASFVGSYMLSNQMRGRAIRVDPATPDKTANIWHLVSMEPLWAYPKEIREALLARCGDGGAGEYPVSEDFELLRRRFRAFLGVGYTQDVIEDGIGRLSIIRPPYDQANIAQINRRMLEMAGDRRALAEKWRRALENCPDAAQVIAVNTVEKSLVPRRFAFLNAAAGLAGSAACEAFLIPLAQITARAALRNPSLLPGALALLAMIAGAGVLLVKALRRFYLYLSPQSALRQIGRAVLAALRETGAVESYTARALAERRGELLTVCYLEGGTAYEKNLFGTCMSQLLGFIDNPRYLLLLRQKFLFGRHAEYLAVPEIFGAKKEKAATFLRCMRRLAGDYSLVYTRSPEGRRTLLRARAGSFINKNNRLLDRSHRVRGKWE